MGTGSGLDGVKFQRLKFRIHGRPDSEVADMLDQLAVRYPAFKKLQKHRHALPLFKYLVYLYDKGSDLHKEFVLLADRKQEAARLSGMAGVVSLSFLNKVFQCTEPVVLECIQTMFTRIFHDRDYREWQTLNKELDDYTSARWDPIEAPKKKRRWKKKGEEDEDDQPQPETGVQNKDTIQAFNLKAKLREECQKIRTLLDALDEKIWGDNEDVKEVAYKARFTSPESFVAAIQESA